MKLKAQALGHEAFRQYGRFEDLLAPAAPFVGEDPIRFYRDLLPLGDMKRLAASVTAVQPVPLVVDVMEYHSHTAEGFLCLDNDAVICVGAATGDGVPRVEEFEAFLLPMGTMVYLHPGVWHYAPFPLGGRPLRSLVLLPERTYANDCIKYEIPEAARPALTL